MSTFAQKNPKTKSKPNLQTIPRCPPFKKKNLSNFLKQLKICPKDPTEPYDLYFTPKMLFKLYSKN